MKIHTRELDDTDFHTIRALLLADGANDWNFITSESIDHQFQLIRDGKAIAVLAEDDDVLGFAILIFGAYCPSKLAPYTNLSSITYVNDVVVSKHHSGKGIGHKLLNECVAISKSRHATAVYIERHEENVASAGMMLKAGFEIVETYYDPAKRFVGSKNTSILKICT